MSTELPIINIHSQPIELCKLLKVANMVSGGGEAKIVIADGYVFLNGEVEFQKRKKVYDQDVIEFDGEAVQVVFSKRGTPAVTNNTIKDKPGNKKKSTKLKVEHLDIPAETSPQKNIRKPISF